MRLFITYLSATLLLSSCALYTGWHDKPTPAPEEKTGATVTTPTPPKKNPADAAEEKASTAAAQTMSPMTH